jgi:uncharacterized protein YggE
MVRIAPFLLVIAGLAAPLPAAAALSAPLPQPAVMNVIGHAEIDAVPDRATVSLTIVTVDADAGRATSANNDRFLKLTQALAPLGISGTAIRTGTFGISYNPRPPQPDPQSSEQYGYRAARSVDVIVPRTDGAGAVIDAAVAAGVTEIGAVDFGLRDPRAAYRRALAAAVADAQAQAAVLAAAAHVRLGRLTSIAPNAGGDYAPRAVLMSNVAMKAASPTQIQPPGNLLIGADVALTYELTR